MDYYDYHTSLGNSFLAVLVMGVAYKGIWLVALKLYTVLKRREVVRRVYSARRRARRLVTAGLRWREKYQSPAMLAAERAMMDEEAQKDMEFGSTLVVQSASSPMRL